MKKKKNEEEKINLHKSTRPSGEVRADKESALIRGASIERGSRRRRRKLIRDCPASRLSTVTNFTHRDEGLVFPF